MKKTLSCILVIAMLLSMCCAGVAAEETAAQESIVVETAPERVEEPIVEEPAQEEPVAEEPVAEEPVAEEPVAEEPVAEEPVAQEPAQEEPAQEEPSTEEEPSAEQESTTEEALPAQEEPVEAEEPAEEEPVEEGLAEKGIANLLTATYFPDKAFLAILEKEYEETGTLSEEDAAAVDTLALDGVTNFKGLQYFKNLQSLSVKNTKTTKLDFSKNATLQFLTLSGCAVDKLILSDCPELSEITISDNNTIKELDASGCAKLETVSDNETLQTVNLSGTAVQNLSFSDDFSIASLNVSNCAQLESLECSCDSLASLNVTGCSALTCLECYGTELTALNLTGCSAITYLDCGDNNLTALNLTGCAEIVSLYCERNALTTLDVSMLTKLETFYCDNNKLTTLKLPASAPIEYMSVSGNAMTSLDVSAYAETLVELSCNNCLLKTLDVAGMNALKELYCMNNALTELLLPESDSLLFLYCEGNLLQEFNLEGMDKLEILRCGNNLLKELDLSGLEGLIELYCDGNMLTWLDTTDNTELNALYCSYNNLEAIGPMDVLGPCSSTNLKEFDCSYNRLGKLDVSENTKLEYLNVSGNNISELALAANTELVELYCMENNLTELKLDGLSALEALDCNNNQLTSIKLPEETALDPEYTSFGWQTPPTALTAYRLNGKLYIPLRETEELVGLDMDCVLGVDEDYVGVTEDDTWFYEYVVAEEYETMLVEFDRFNEMKIEFAFASDHIVVKPDSETEFAFTGNYLNANPVFTVEAEDGLFTYEGGKIISGSAKGEGYLYAKCNVFGNEIKCVCRVTVDNGADITVNLPRQKASLNVFSTDYVTFPVQLVFEGQAPSALTAKSVENKNAGILTGAEFADPATAALFDLMVVSASELAIVPKLDKVQEAVKNTKVFGKTYKSAVKVTVEGYDGTFASEKMITLTITQTKPKITAKMTALNSYFIGSQAPITFTGGVVEAVTVDPSKCPVWIFVNEQGTAMYVGDVGKSVSGKVVMQCSVKGFAVPADVTLSVSAKSTAPKITVKNKSLKMGNVDDYAYVNYTFTPNDYAVENEELAHVELVSITEKVGGKTVNVANGSTIAVVPGYYGCDVGTYVTDGAKHTYTVTLALCVIVDYDDEESEVVKKTNFTFTVATANTAPTVTAKATGTINVNYPQTRVIITPTVKNVSSAYVGVVDIIDNKKVSVIDSFEWDYDGVNIYVYAAEDAELSASKTYTAQIATGVIDYCEGVPFITQYTSKPVSVKLPVTAAALKPSVTLKANSGTKIDLVTGAAQQFTVTMKDLFFDDAEFFVDVTKTYDGATKKTIKNAAPLSDEETPFRYTIESVNDTTALLTVALRDGVSIDPKDKYSITLTASQFEKDYLSKPMSLTLAASKVTVTADNANAWIVGNDAYDTFKVRLNANYDIDWERTTLDATGLKYFDIEYLSDGTYLLSWLDHTLPTGKNAVKSGKVLTIKLNLFVPANSSATANATVSVKVNVD